MGDQGSMRRPDVLQVGCWEPVGVPRGLLKNFYQGAEKMGAVVFKALRVRYCSGIVKLKFSDKNGPR